MFCGKCGNQISPEDAFCAVCGQTTQQQTQQGEGMPPGAMVATQTNGYHGLLAANGLTQNVRHFDGLYTQIAVSENGYIAIYYPYVPAVKGNFVIKGSPELPERIEILHVSQINDFNIEYEGTEETKVSGGFGGALVGGLLGGTTGAIIGSAATSGKAKTTTTITGANLIINTKDFNRPRIEVRLFSPFSIYNAFSGGTETVLLPYRLRQHCTSKVGSLDKEGKELAKGVFCNGEINTAQIEMLESMLTQMLAAQQQSAFAATVTPQLSSADELVKFKGLLDGGIITQEEFDAKKRQLLGV